jgi:putative aldouronate transport system permease protein
MRENSTLAKRENASISAPTLLTHKKSRFQKNLPLLIMCLPVILFFTVFSYLPMPGIYLAFIDFNYRLGIFRSQFVGFTNFKFLVISGDLWRLTKNTILYNAAFILLGNCLQVAVAILISELSAKWFKKVSQTIMFLPHFISYVLVGLFAYNLLNYDYGIINNVLLSIGAEPIKFYSNPNVWPYILVGTFLWKTTGYGSIIYFATIAGIDPSINDAAQIDGASTFQRIRHIVLPSIRPTFIILLLFSIGGILRGNFAMFYNIVGANNALLFQQTDIIETFVFRALMNNFNFSLGSAVSLYQSVFGFALIMISNWLVRRVEPEYALF